MTLSVLQHSLNRGDKYSSDLTSTITGVGSHISVKKKRRSLKYLLFDHDPNESDRDIDRNEYSNHLKV